MDDALKPRWYRFTPDRLILGLLAVVGWQFVDQQQQYHP